MKSFYLALALCFVYFALASTEKLTENDRLCAGFEGQGEGCREYLDRCEESGTALKDLTKYHASHGMILACAKKAIDVGNNNLVLTVVKRSSFTSDTTKGIVNYAAQKGKRELLKKIFAFIKSLHGGHYKPEIQKLAEGALKENVKDQTTKVYLERKAAGRSASWLNILRRT